MSPRRQHSASLRDIAAMLQDRGLLRGASPDPSGSAIRVTADSRQVGADTAFVAIRGSRTDGHRFLDDAAARGASVLVVESTRHLPAAYPYLHVSDSAEALGYVAHLLSGRAADALTMVGVTGTNGKTTTGWLIAQALGALGRKAGFVGTIGFGIPGHLQTTTHTTPDAASLHDVLAAGVADGWEACSMEVSSHALVQQRTAGINFSAAVFTNLTHDHLDYHTTMEEYAGAKARLFEPLDEEARAIVNADDAWTERILRACRARVTSFGTSGTADVTYRLVGEEPGGLSLELDGRLATFRVPGRFNSGNLAAAYSTLLGLGFDADISMEALGTVRPAPGRFEPVRSPSGTRAIVDYAHTPDALRNVLEAARATGAERIWCVVGCGGERDAAKRPVMARIAEEGADEVVLTSDNPRSEAPQGILDDMVEGLAAPVRVHTIVDRAEAIRYALNAAGEGDLVVVAGKGHETYQVLADRTIDFDDRVVIREAAPTA